MVFVSNINSATALELIQFIISLERVVVYSGFFSEITIAQER